MKQLGLSCARPEEEGKYDKWGPYSPLRKHCAGFAPNMPTASKKQILLAVIFLDAEINPAGDPTLKKTCSMVHSWCQSAKNHPWDHSWHLFFSCRDFDRRLYLVGNMKMEPKALLFPSPYKQLTRPIYFFFIYFKGACLNLLYFNGIYEGRKPP